MPSTFQALAVAMLALLPGALYEVAREQRSGRWGSRGVDQILRLLAFSVLFQVVISPLTYWLYSHYVVSGHLKDGKAVSGWLWLLLISYLVVPFMLGRFTAWAQQMRDRSSADQSRPAQLAARVVSIYTNAAPAPRAWDYLWSRPDLLGWVVLHLKDGGRIAGEWNGSYASGYPEPCDLYMSDQVELDDEGKFVMNGDGLPRSLGKALLIRWDEVRNLDFYSAYSAEDEDQSREQPDAAA